MTQKINDQFLTLFNDIEQELRRRNGHDLDDTGFKAHSRRFGNRHPWWSTQIAERMDHMADIRNLLAHKTNNSHGSSIEVNENAVAYLKGVRKQLMAPRRVEQDFTVDVVRLQARDPLQTALGIIRDRDITHIPIYDGDIFTGLLTTNGISYWLATSDPHVGLAELDVPVENALTAQEKRPNCAFIPRTMPTNEAFDLFRQDVEIEALLITHRGSKSETPIGIITFWDVAHYVKP
jgi:CBS domain-containing protein